MPANALESRFLCRLLDDTPRTRRVQSLTGDDIPLPDPSEQRPAFIQ